MSNHCKECGLPLSSNAIVCDRGHPVPPKSQQPPHVVRPPRTTVDDLIRQYPGAKQPQSFDPGFRLNCPFCNLEFHPNDCAIYSTLRFDDNRHNVRLRRAPLSRFIARRRPVSPLDGPEYAQDAACRQCPRCKNFLPYRFEIDADFTIAMVGDSASGKSHYLAALLHQLKNSIQQQKNIRLRLAPVNNLAKKKWQEYQEILFEHRGTLPVTGRFHPSDEELKQNFSVREPLIFRLVLEFSRSGESVTSQMHVVFYDMAGEDFVNEDSMQRFGWPLLHAQAIIYFADTLNMSRILDSLPADNPLVMASKEDPKRERPHDVLERIRLVFARYSRLSDESKVSTPIAIMLPKSDLLDPIANANGFGQARFLKDSVYDGRVDVEDIETVNRDVQKVLEQFGEVELIADSFFRFTTASFFATSATGCTADDNGQFREVKPRRCLDPFFWLLWKLTQSNRRKNSIS